jgi:hypothetical protein
MDPRASNISYRSKSIASKNKSYRNKSIVTEATEVNMAENSRLFNNIWKDRTRLITIRRFSEEPPYYNTTGTSPIN